MVYWSYNFRTSCRANSTLNAESNTNSPFDTLNKNSLIDERFDNPYQPPLYDARFTYCGGVADENFVS